MPSKSKNQLTRNNPQVKKVKRRNRKAIKRQIKVSKLRQMIRSVRWTESYVSLLMGIIVVIIGVLFVVSVMRQTHHIQETSSTSTVAMVSESPTHSAGSLTPMPSELKHGGKTYTVQAGDDLWHIAEKEYKSGYNWVDIAKANNLSDPSMIFSGNVLVIPSVTPQVATITATPTSSISSDNTITGKTYTVQAGDDLWHIAVRAYADGYQWVKIAQANNLSSPDLIFSGNILKIPR